MKLLLLLVVTAKFCQCDNILAIIPTASYSHQAPFRPLWRELHSRGHHLTIVTADPMNDPSLKNITEIDIHVIYDVYKKHNFTTILSNLDNDYMKTGMALFEMITDSTEVQFNLPEVKNLIQNDSISFDLLIVEAQYPCMLSFSWKFKCPWISVRTLDAPVQDHYVVGNSVHTSLYPEVDFAIENVENLNFRDRLKSFLFTYLYLHYFNSDYLSMEHERMKKYFGESLPSLKDIHRNMSMMFINVNSIFHNVRSVTPTTILIGDGIHVLPPKPLPKDLQEFLDDVDKGAIYFSLGSNVDTDLVGENTVEAILGAFRELPSYKILWKFDNRSVSNVPSNVRIQGWFPQQDVLRHPNVKLFITQGGLQSLQEALTNSVPLVCIPFFGDQMHNTQKMVIKGVAVKLDKKKITKESFKEAISEVLDNPKYKEKAVELGKILRDEPMTGLEKAVWWTEYVLRHKGARHLRSPATDIPFYQYYFLDILGFFIIVTLVPLYVFYRLTKYVWKKLFAGKKQKQKTS